LKKLNYIHINSYLLEIGYWNPSSNNTNSINDIRNFKHNNESSSTVNTLPNNNSLQKSIKTATYTPINKEKSLKPINPSSPNINNNTGAGGISNSNNNSINGNSSEYSMFMKKKMTGKRKEAPLSKLCKYNVKFFFSFLFKWIYIKCRNKIYLKYIYIYIN